MTRTLFDALPRDAFPEPVAPHQGRGPGPLELPDGPYSHSRLQLLLECPRHFWMRYIARVPEPRSTKDPFDVGSRVHDAIEAASRQTLETGRPGEWILRASEVALDGLDPKADERKMDRISLCLSNCYYWMLDQNLWWNWSAGVVNVEQPFALTREGKYLPWDGDQKNKPKRAELCFILDHCVRFQYIGTAYLYDWKAGWKRRKPLTREGVDPQLLLYAYGLFCADSSLHTIYATFFNVMWSTPEPAVGFPRDLTIEAARRYIDSCEADMFQRDPGLLDAWEAEVGASCFFCAYDWDCVPKQSERIMKARERLLKAPKDHPLLVA